jgi:hypothetical protein
MSCGGGIKVSEGNERKGEGEGFRKRIIGVGGEGGGVSGAWGSKGEG